MRTVITGHCFNRDSDRSHPPRLFSISGKARPDFILCALPLFCHSRVLLSPICWLAGVRRVGKSTLAKSLGEERMIYVNCDLPVTRDMIADPELFYRNCTHPVVVFDEVHQLPDPSMVLKIGADLFPHLKIMATGSSTLAASRKFKATLTAEKSISSWCGSAMKLTPSSANGARIISMPMP